MIFLGDGIPEEARGIAFGRHSQCMREIQLIFRDLSVSLIQLILVGCIGRPIAIVIHVKKSYIYDFNSYFLLFSYDKLKALGSRPGILSFDGEANFRVVDK